MTEKVKLTREQVEAFEKYKSNGHKMIHFVRHGEFGFNSEYEPLRGLPVDDMARLLYELNSFEVEEEYKVDDMVRYWKNDAVSSVGNITFINFEKDQVQFDNCTVTKRINDIKRHASPEEIKAEQERRLWAKIGREVGEFREGDYGEHLGHGYHSTDKGTLANWYRRGKLKGFYPVESFISFEEGGESNA